MVTVPTPHDVRQRSARPLRVEVDDVVLSGLEAEPAGSPRGLLVALHGGGSRARYFDSPVAPESSLMGLAAAVGWRAVALDRPGYGESGRLRERRLDSAAQAPLLRAALDRLADGLPVLLVAHSLGAIAALRVARMVEREPSAVSLVGVAMGGAPLAYTPEQLVQIAQADSSGHTLRRLPGQKRRPLEEWLGPIGSFPAQLETAFREVFDTVPSGELDDAYHAPELIAGLLAELRVPVQFAVAEHEQTMAPAEQVLARAAEVMRPTVGTELLQVPGSGHNLSLGHRARAYHLRVLSFAEQRLADMVETDEGKA